MTDQSRKLARLRELATRLEGQALFHRNSAGNMHAEAEAGRLQDDANAVRWAMEQAGASMEGVE